MENIFQVLNLPFSLFEVYKIYFTNYNSLPQPFHSTIEDIYVANVDTDRGTRESVRFIDTEGLETDASALAPSSPSGVGGPREIARHWHSIADGFVVVYSVDDERSFQERINSSIPNFSK